MEFDYVIIGSGFGGSVSALRLSEKGYKVLVIEKGKWFRANDFAKTNWNVRKWLWAPKLGMKGIFKMTFLRHITVLSGVGVGGGSLTYANTLPVPKKAFFKSGTWAELEDWEEKLAPHYEEAHRMLGAAVNPTLGPADRALKQLSREIGKEKDFSPTKVAVFFGEPDKTVPDPYFNGKGPERTGCNYCGACMTGCRNNSKNTLDKNYLWFAQMHGAEIRAETKVFNVEPIGEPDGSQGYTVHFKSTFVGKKTAGKVTTKGVIFAGGVMGTVPLLLRLQKTSLPRISPQLGEMVRTNNEALVFVTSLKKNQQDFSRGVAIGSILHTDEDSHLEPVRYGQGSGFFRLMSVPMAYGKHIFKRFFTLSLGILKSPIKLLRAVFTPKYARKTSILLFMQTLDSTIRLEKGGIAGIKSKTGKGKAPSAFIPRAGELVSSYEKIVEGKAFVGFTETLFGIPTTAHILGGCVMGESAERGVIDKHNQVFGYQNMLICDGSAISANPGVNPSLSITAISEHAMSQIPAKETPA